MSDDVESGWEGGGRGRRSSRKMVEHVAIINLEHSSGIVILTLR